MHIHMDTCIKYAHSQLDGQQTDDKHCYEVANQWCIVS